jgi:hypothetical protein
VDAPIIVPLRRLRLSLCANDELSTLDAARRLRVTAATVDQMVRSPLPKSGMAMSIRGHVVPPPRQGHACG